MHDFRTTVDLAAKETFRELDYVGVEVENSHIFITPTLTGFESMSTTQILTDSQKGIFNTNIILERRIDIIESPLKKIFADYNSRLPTFATTIWFTYDYFLNEKKQLQFEISEKGIAGFKEMIYNGHSEIKKLADDYDNILALDELVNRSFLMNDLAKQILIENIPRIIKRLVIAKLAGNKSWGIYFEKSLAEHDHALNNAPNKSFKKIINKRIESLNETYSILTEIESI